MPHLGENNSLENSVSQAEKALAQTSEVLSHLKELAHTVATEQQSPFVSKRLKLSGPPPPSSPVC